MPALHDAKELEKLPLFRGLGQEDLEWLNEQMNRREMASKKHLLLASQPGDTVYIIQNGTVKIHVEQSDGTDVTLAILGIGDIVGEMSLMDQAGRSANAVTLERSIILSMHKSVFQECIRKMPSFTENMMRILARRLRVANEQIQALCRLDVHGRVARMILTFAEQYGQESEDEADTTDIPIRLTQTDIASLVGATRERVNKVMKDYKERGHISVNSKYHISVHNETALSRRTL
ncbi:MAG: hypothetical protein CL920_30070 [Deltaproteobacteria bacterium]|nr:hypothetical protein [Deltaproteobacteria bacterium]MBU52959.1 hypothetical protein [Deltaproteobacteria bacterium]|tara:strand:+ start:5606 stop:6307 length:702 start_codon:yes stop_codon:yes gene_type:complete